MRDLPADARTDPDSLGLRDAETRLQDAMTSGDTTTLDGLLDAEAVYVDPDGTVVDRASDLDAYRSGALRIVDLRELDADVLVRGEAGVTRVLLALVVEAGGRRVSVTYRYTRCWHRGADGWRVLAAHASAASSERGTRDTTATATQA